MDDNNHEFPGVSVDTSDPEDVSEFTTKDDFPDEVSDQWDSIRSGKHVLVDETGHIVDDLHEAYYLLAPATMGGGGGLPPVGTTPIGEPDDPAKYDVWIDPETMHAMMWDGEATRVLGGRRG